MFLQGRQQESSSALTESMEAASAELAAFEQAAVYRDQIALAAICAGEAVRRKYARRGSDMTWWLWKRAAWSASTSPWCAAAAPRRPAHFPAGGGSCTPEEALNAFLEQHYLDHPIPIARSGRSAGGRGASALAEVATAGADRRAEAGHVAHVGGDGAAERPKIAITARRTTLSLQGKRQQALAEALGLESLDRIECFDISHTQGEKRPSPPASSMPATA